MSSKSSKPKVKARGALDLCEQAMHLLQNAPLGFYIRYALAVAPFVLALLFFWSDMATSAFARQHLLSASVAMVAAFVWMKFWQALACYRLRCMLYAVPPSRWRMKDLAGLAIRQATWHPTGFLMQPFAMLLTLPFPACYAFYQNLTVLESPADDTITKPLARRAAEFARPWPQQGFRLLAIHSELGLVVMLNLLSIFGFAPMLAKRLLGIETPFSQNPMLIFNSTVLMCTLLGSYFLIDLVAKVCCLLRCYDLESLGNAQDLRAEWHRLQRRRATAMTGLIVVFGLILAPPAARGQEAVPESGKSVSAFNEAADHVLTDRRYVWRQPRNDADSLRAVQLPGWVATLRDWFERVVDWIFQRRKPPNPGSDANLGFLQGLTSYALYGVIAVLGACLLYQFIRHRRGSKEMLAEIVPETVDDTPDLTQEDIAADALPSSEWTLLGAKLLAEGNYRLALRAYHLAVLAHLADHRIILYARHKSNRDYLNEVHRREHTYPQIPQPFGSSVRLFERTWYGRYHAQAADVETLKIHFQQIHEGLQTTMPPIPA